MKKLIIAALLIIGATVSAQAQKLGHANFEEIVTLLPERAAAEKEIQELQLKLEGRLNKMVETYQAKVTEFESDTSMSEAMQASAAGEIQDLQKRIQEFQQTAYTEIETKQNELMAGMFEKVRVAAVAVGEAGGYTYIFDASNGSLLFAGGEDVTAKVKVQLGL
ncbi:OmpH family outer membrane protein [Cryomorphaceae bacterium 1068]|nr:OmpH family outer membrane protein [Cryomorphaceae bacterium 1068]